MARIMIAGVSSGSGKTSFTCGLLYWLNHMGIRTVSMKCGPDYIDPSFHETVLGVRSGNLDPYFLTDSRMRWLVDEKEKLADLLVMEGAMGFYDGIGFSDQHSSHAVSLITGTPVILIVDCRGMAYSAAALISGFLKWIPRNNIRGLILNRFPEGMYEEAKYIIESEFHIPVIGYLPVMKDCVIPSRHLGLMNNINEEELLEIIRKISVQIFKTVQIDKIIEIASSAVVLNDIDCYPVKKTGDHIRIAVASDEAFSFIYPDNIDLLNRMGIDISYFSPLRDQTLPDNVNGLILCGGYPELYAKELSENRIMRQNINEAVSHGMPCLAECGGYLYLHEFLEDQDRKIWEMVGCISGTGKKGDRLSGFGYVEVTAAADYLLAEAGIPLKAHEFHYWKSTDQNNHLTIKKMSRPSSWKGGTVSESVYAGFPHFYFYGNPGLAERFIERCKKYGSEKNT